MLAMAIDDLDIVNVSLQQGTYLCHNFILISIIILLLSRWHLELQ